MNVNFMCNDKVISQSTTNHVPRKGDYIKLLDCYGTYKVSKITHNFSKDGFIDLTITIELKY